MIKFLLYLEPFSLLAFHPAFVFPYIVPKHFVFRTLVELAFVLNLLLKKNFAFKPALLFFLSIFGVINLLGINPVNSVFSNYERMDGYLNLIHLVMFFYLTVSVLNKKDLRYLTGSLIVVNFLSNIAYLIRPENAGLIGNTAYMAAFNLLSMVLILLCLFKNKSYMSYMTYTALIGLNLYVSYHTGSRAWAVSIFVFIACMAFRYLDKKAVISFMLIGALYAGGFFTYVSDSKMAGKMHAIESVKTRILAYKYTLKGWQERPLTGYGQENFYAVHSKHFPARIFEKYRWLDNPHSVYLEWLIETGIIGLALYLSIFVLTFRRIIKGDMTYYEKSVIYAGLLAYMTHNLFMFDTLVSYVPFIILLGYVWSENET